MQNAKKNKISLREWKKAKTRSDLIEAANRLFIQQGYDKTPLKQIAHEVNVSIHTLLNYFDTKMHLALADNQNFFNAFRDEIADRDTDTVSCWRNHVGQGVKRYFGQQMVFSDRVKFLYKEPVLAAGLLAIRQQYEDLLAKNFAFDAGVDPEEDLHGRLLAAMLVAGNAAAIRHWVESGAKKSLADTALAIVDLTLEILPAGGKTALN